MNAATAATMDAALKAHGASGRQRPFFDFDHANGPASAWPAGFSWRNTPEPGVYARVEWSAEGATAVSGRAYRAFSPTFFIDAGNPASVTGAPLNMGGLVNDPAFTAIKPLWAKSPEHTMNKTPKLVALIAALGALQGDRAALAASQQPDQAAINAKDAEISARLVEAKSLVVQIDADASEKDTLEAIRAKSQVVEAENASLRAQTQALQSERTGRVKADALNAVKAAVARGAIPAANDALQARWADAYQRDPAGTEALLAGLAAPAALGAPVVPNASGNASVGGELVRAVRAYGEEKNPKRRFAIYAKEIRKALADANGYQEAIEAANSVGTLAGTLVTQRSLDLLKFTFPVLGRITTDFTSENAALNQTVTTRRRSVPTVTDYNATTGYARSDATTTDVSITIDKHKAVEIGFTANDLSSTRRLLFGEQEEGMHYALGKAMVDDLYALILAAAYTNTTTQAQAGFDRSTLVTLAQALTLRGVPTMGRALLLNTPYFGQLQTDASIVQLGTFQDRSLIQEYKLPPIAGFQPLEAPNLPTTGSLAGFAFTPDAIAMATRVPNDYASIFPGATGGGVTTVVTNEDTGISVMQVQYVNHQLGQSALRVALMYGVATAQVASGQLLLSA
ncbi:MAG: hypothetical protein DVB31_02920 [Verrucomicrobia bacterium]|nr:MAG: hypothetical protein DVB31_02920 [Verrucomicrobiota bacterium]